MPVHVVEKLNKIQPLGAEAPRRARARADGRWRSPPTSTSGRGGRADQAQRADAGLAREAGRRRGGVRVRPFPHRRVEPLPEEAAEVALRREALRSILDALSPRERAGARAALRPRRPAAAHARRGGAGVQRHARAHPPDRAPEPEEAARARRTRRETSRDVAPIEAASTARLVGPAARRDRSMPLDPLGGPGRRPGGGCPRAAPPAGADSPARSRSSQRKTTRPPSSTGAASTARSRTAGVTRVTSVAGRPLQSPRVSRRTGCPQGRARRVHRDPLRLRRPGARGRRPPGGGVGAERIRARRRRGRVLERGASGRSSSARCRPRASEGRADDPLLRPLRRAAARPARALGVATLRARRARRLALRAAASPTTRAQLFMLLEGGASCSPPRASCPSTCASRATGGGDRRPLDRRLAGAGRARRATRRSSSTAAWSRATCPRSRTALRGLCFFHVTVRTGERDLHSGRLRRRGAQRDARARCRRSRRVIPAGRPRSPSRSAPVIVPPTDEEIAGWCAMPSGARSSPPPARARPTRGRGGVLPAHAGRAVCRRARHRRRLTAPREDGDPGRSAGERLDPARARAGPQTIVAMFERLLREAAPAGRDVEIELLSSRRPGSCPRTRRLSQLGAGRVRARARHAPAADPLRRRHPARLGARRRAGVPTILTGFALNESNVHSPNERLVARVPAARARDDVRAVPPPGALG